MEWFIGVVAIMIVVLLVGHWIWVRVRPVRPVRMRYSLSEPTYKDKQYEWIKSILKKIEEERKRVELRHRIFEWVVFVLVVVGLAYWLLPPFDVWAFLGAWWQSIALLILAGASVATGKYLDERARLGEIASLLGLWVGIACLIAFVVSLF